MNKWILALALLISTQALAKGKIQNEDIKSLSELTAAGGNMSQLPNDTKVYVTANGINAQLSTAISSGLIGGGGGSSGVNILSDPGFEITGNLASYWTASGGTLTQITAGSNLLIGVGSATYQSTAGSQSMQSNLYVVPNGLKGSPCVASAIYKGADDNYFFTVSDGTNTLASVQMVASTSPRPIAIPFQCPSSGSIQIKISALASGAVMALDQMFLGQNTITQVSQANLFGTVSVPGGCNYSGNVTGDFSDGGTCTGATFTGGITSFTTSNGAININNLPPGEYEVVASGGCYTNTANTNTSIVMIDDPSSQSGQPYNLYSPQLGPNFIQAPCNVRAHFSYTTAANRSFKMQGGGTVVHGIQFPFGAEAFTIYKFPTQSETLVSANTQNWVGTFYQNSLTDIGLGQSSFATSALQATGLTTYQDGGNTLTGYMPCSGGNDSSSLTSCSAGTPELGIAFDLPAAQKVKVCAKWVHHYQTNGAGAGRWDNVWGLYESDNINESTILQTPVALNETTVFDALGTAQNNTTMPFYTCGIFNWNTPGKKTIRLYLAQTTTGTPGTNNNVLLSAGGQEVRWQLTPITQNVPAPIFLPPAAFRVGDMPTGPNPSASIAPAIWGSLGNFGFDTDNGYDTITGYYTVKTAGLWHFDCSLNMNQTAGTDYQYDVYLIKAGGAGIFSQGQIFYDATATASRSRITKTSNDIMVNAGDQIYCASSLNIPGTWTGDYSTNYFEGHLIH